MSNILAALERVDLLTALWLFPVAYALHELEEWNIMRWYDRNYKDLPPATARSARTWIVFISLLSFAWFGLAILIGNPSLAAFLVLPAIAIAVQNALQHVYWVFLFKEYAPGVVTSVVLLIPIGVYLVAKAVDQGLVPFWYVVLWLVLMVPGLFQTVKAGNEMTSSMRAIHHIGIKLSTAIFGSP